MKDEFRLEEVAAARALVRAHPFATIAADLRATHMPCLVDDDADGLAIVGHVAHADPVSESLDRMGDTAREMADKVVAFRLRADSWHAEAKLSQDKPEDERARLLAGLERPGPYANAPLAAAMRSSGSERRG